ncbi:MAG: DUF1284 domain-containing protein [Nitrospiraceae bacterium]|nr:MAG: DUF1284 domain-containing protein [Nitrospiraceae bacterium]
MPLLRGHHLICLHFFHGEGYDEAFIENLRHTLNRTQKEIITVSSGADNVCANCVHLKQNTCRYEEDAEESIQEMDTKALEFLGLSCNDQIRWDTLKNRIPEIFSQWFSLYCRECNWRRACEKNEAFQKLSGDK